MTTAVAKKENEVVQVDDLSIVEQQTRAETDIQISTAKRFPRSIRRFIEDCHEMATLNEAVAESCFYVLPRGGKKLDGPSARLAEIIISAWGNCDAGARVISEGKNFVTAQGVFRDLERNTRITFEVQRRITDKNGNRFNDDMIGVTANAACSIALRNAVFKGVPKAYWEPIYHAAREAAVGNAETLDGRRVKMMDYFVQKLGVDEAKVYAAAGVKGFEDIGLDELITLKGFATSIKEGEASIDTIFNPKTVASKPKGNGLSDALSDDDGKVQPDNDKENDETSTGGGAEASLFDQLVNALMERTGADADSAEEVMAKALAAFEIEPQAITDAQFKDYSKRIADGNYDSKLK